MSRSLRLGAIVGVQAGLVALLALGLLGGRVPLGVPGEWEWLRVPFGPDAFGLITAGVALAGYTIFVVLGMRGLSRREPGRWVEAAGLAGLVVAAVVVQGLLPTGAPLGYGLTRWVALAMPGSSGYQTVAREEVRDAWSFWAAYPTWIEGQDALHIGTHPPGLILWAHAARRSMETRPELAKVLDEHAPASVRLGFRELVGPLSRSDRAAIVLTAALTLLACAATVAPLYLLARVYLPPTAAWAAASLWPLVPSAVLFAPAADTAFPLISTTALALAAWSIRWRGWAGGLLAVATGALLALGMQLTLAFLAIGLIVALMLSTTSEGPENQEKPAGWRRRGVLMMLVGAGFLAATLGIWAVSGANPFVIWWWNQAHHARFYVEYPRSYGAWLVANPVELAVGLGLPVTFWMVLGLARPRQAPAVAWATLATLVLLTISGRNLSEIARLWLPMMPPLLVAAGAGMARLDARARDLGGTAALLGLQTMILQANIQVVYPV